jgi:hypothetical protein
MKRLLQLGFILGLGGMLAAGYFFPWVDYPRYRSDASVVANGGRVEQFLVRLPADRIGAAIDAPAADPALSPVIEHFKLRDANGNVIGIAARHQLTVGDHNETAWLLTIPSRGTIALAASSSARDSLESLLAARGVMPGQNVSPELSIDAGAPATSVAATGEFSGIKFELVETWIVTGLEEDGQVRGTLRLSTVGRSTS